MIELAGPYERRPVSLPDPAATALCEDRRMATAATTREEIAGTSLRELDRLVDAMAARVGEEVP